MALNKTLSFDLELKPGGIPPIIHASQGDIGRMFKANIYWDGAAATSYVSGATVNLRGKKPDKTVFDYTATLAGSMVTFETTEQMTIISGPVECELVFTQSGDVIASANFVLMVEDSPYNPDAPSESVIPGIEDIVADVVDDVVGDDVGDWLDEHPEATTTVQDGAITKAKINTAFLPEIKNAYVTPEMFGAKGDGTTDDTQAIIDAFDYAKTSNLPLISARNTYKTTSSCILDYGNYNVKVFLDGVFDYLEIRANQAVMHRAEIHIGKVTTFKVVNTLGFHVDVGEVQDFYLIGDKNIQGNGANAYNYFTGLYYRNIHIQALNGGWCNESKFYSMRVNTLSIEGNDSHYCDCHRFYDIALENSTVTLSKTRYNYILASGEGGITLNETNAWGTIVERTYTSVKLGFDMPTTTENGTYYGNQIFKYFSFKEIYNLNINNYYADANDYVAKRTSIGTWKTLTRMYIKLDEISALHITSDISCYTLYITILDDDFANVTTSADVNNLFRANGANFRSGSDPYYDFGGVLRQNQMIVFDKSSTTAKWARVTISTTSSTKTPRFIKADFGTLTSTPYLLETNFGDHLKSATTPTNTSYPYGTFVENSAGTSKGWIYTTSGWQTIT